MEHDHSECENLLLFGLGQEAECELPSDSSARAQVLVACLKALLSGLVPSVKGIIFLNRSSGAFLQTKS